MKLTEIQKGIAPTYCVPWDTSSTQCELRGILGWVTALESNMGNNTIGTIYSCRQDVILYVAHWRSQGYICGARPKESHAKCWKANKTMKAFKVVATI